MGGIDPAGITLAGIFVAGLATSLHCAGMCGLLTCGLGIGGNSSQTASIGVYHFFRMVGYFIAGSLAGGIGQLLGLDAILPGLNWLPWLLILLLVVIALGADRRLGAIPGLGKAVNFIRMKTMNVPILLRAGIVGISTPLLPCGPLYAVLAIALASGSWLMGAKLMLAFGVAPIPAIWLTQVAASWYQGRLNSRQLQTGRKVLAGLAAVSLSWHFVFPYILLARSGKSLEPGQPACQCELHLKTPVEE